MYDVHAMYNVKPAHKKQKKKKKKEEEENQ